MLDQIVIAVETVARFAFKKAANEEKQKNAEKGFPENELSVSGDGSWAKRGFSSLLGIVSLIGKYSNKNRDVIIKSSICKGCQYLAQKNPVEAESLYEDHKAECMANHEGSASKMEVDGVLEMFKRSLEYFGVKSVKYIGDGDSKTHKKLVDGKPYDGEPDVEKQECVLHVKKRIYRHLQATKKTITEHAKVKKQIEDAEQKKIDEEEKKKAEEEGKPALRKLKTVARKSSESKQPKPLQLTNKLMLKLSTYYGLAITRNSNSLEDMRKAVWATFFHYTYTDAKPQHSNCSDSWCKYLKHNAEKPEEPYVHPSWPSTKLLQSW